MRLLTPKCRTRFMVLSSVPNAVASHDSIGLRSRRPKQHETKYVAQNIKRVPGSIQTRSMALHTATERATRFLWTWSRWVPGCLFTLITRRATRRRQSEERCQARRYRRVMFGCVALLLTVVGFSGAAIASSSAAAGPAPLTAMTVGVFQWIWTQLQRLDHLVMPGVARDVLGLMAATTLVVPWMSKLGTSSIIGFLLIGVLLGPSGYGVISNIHMTHVVGELGIVFFLFEMGLEVSVDKIWAMRFDVFGLGVIQYIGTGILIAMFASRMVPSLSPVALLVLGGGLALSTSAFVLQLIRDKGQLGTRFGKACLGVLLFQDIAVVPLLVVIPLLLGGGSVLAALSQAVLRGVLAFGLIWYFGKTYLDRIYKYVNRYHSTEAFLSVTLVTVMLCSSITEGLGLSNTLGAFLGGVLLSESSYVHQVEADIAPFRGMLLGLFFITVGFSIDLVLVVQQFFVLVPIVILLLVLKALVVGGACLASGMSGPSTAQTAALLAPGGEFAFVVFGMAVNLGIMPEVMASVLVTSTALSMGLTPILDKIGADYATKLRVARGTEAYTGKDEVSGSLVEEVTQSGDSFVAVCGYGRAGKVICNILDDQNIRYIAFDPNPVTAIKARSSGLPVFMADPSDPQVLESFKVNEARLVVIAIGAEEATERVAQAVVETCPQPKVLVRTSGDDQKELLESTLNVEASVSALPTDSELMSISFAGSVLHKLGTSESEIKDLIDERQRQLYESQTQRSSVTTLAELQEIFKVYDADGSGALSRFEVRDCMSSFQTIDDDTFDPMYTELCDDNDELNFEGFIKLVESESPTITLSA